MGSATYNKHLEKFKDTHKDMEAVLMCTGDSINEYKPIIGENIITVGVNNIYKYPNLVKTLNYYFFGSGYELEPDRRTSIRNLDDKIIKMASSYRDGKPTGYGNILPENCKDINAIPFECGLVDFTNDIANDKMLGHSIVFPSLQFLLYTGVKKINIVGADIYGFYNTYNENHLYEWWAKFSEWFNKNYSNVEINIINPKKLKGMFNDVYQ